MKVKAEYHLLLLFILLLIFIPSVEAKSLNLYIMSRDSNWSLEPIKEIYEGETFVVYVTDSDNQPLSNYTIIFNGETYHVDRSSRDYPFFYLVAPNVDRDESMYVIVRKEGYEDAQSKILVKNRAIFVISPSTFNVRSGEKISIQVRDENGNPVSGADVKLQVDGKTVASKTGIDGISIIQAPKVVSKTVAYINVSKEGYQNARIDGFIVPPQPTVNIFNTNTLKIVGIALLILFLFTGSVKYLQKKEEVYEDYPLPTGEIRNASAEPQYIPSHEEHKEKPAEDINERKPDTKKSIEIEEIVIGKPKEKITGDRGDRYLDMKRSERRTVSSNVKTKPDTWVVGEDYIMKKIDEKLGKAENNKDISKWFTGKEDIVEKVDKKLKELEKKKKSNPS